MGPLVLRKIANIVINDKAQVISGTNFEYPVQRWVLKLVFLYNYEVVISVCLFVCPIITQKPLDRFALNFDRGTRETHGKLGFEI